MVSLHRIENLTTERETMIVSSKTAMIFQTIETNIQWSVAALFGSRDESSQNKSMPNSWA
jgi:hypothetical protein